MMLRIYHKFLYRAYPFLYTDHWEYLIKMISTLSLFVLQNVHDIKFTEKISVSVVELFYNAWIFSGIQDEQIWTFFKKSIHEILTKDFVVSYWIDICSELTAKLLIDNKCYDPPKLVVSVRDEQIECHENLLIINHNYNYRRIEPQPTKEFSVFQQPFIFNISKEQTLYLWGKMIMMMPESPNPKIQLLIIKGIQSVINILLTLGAHAKPQDEIQEFGLFSGYKSYRIENKRIIKIEHDYAYFKKILTYITEREKINRNTRKPVLENQISRNPSEDDKPETITKRSSRDLDLFEPALIFKKPEDDHLNNEETEYSWIVKTDKIPTGDSLIKLFGKVLFNNSQLANPNFEEVRLAAISILCQIFTKSTGPFSEGSVKKFYKVYLEYLERELPWGHFQTLVRYSTDIFLVNHLPNNIILQKPLITRLLDYYIKGKLEISAQDRIFRRACNKFCSSLVCFINDEYALINEVYRYDKNVKDILYELLELAFQKDRDFLISQRVSPTKVQREEVKILAQSAWNFMIYSSLNHKLHPFVSKINEIWFDKNFSVMTNFALDLLLTLGEMGLARLDEFEIPCPMALDIFLAGQSAIEKVKRFVEQRMKDLTDSTKQPPLKPGEKEEIIKQLSTAFGIAHTWLLIIIHIKEIEDQPQKKDFLEIFESTTKMLIAYQTCEPFVLTIKSILSSLFNKLGNLTFTRNTPVSSSILFNDDQTKIRPFEEWAYRLEEKCILSIGLGDDTLLSFYDLKIESTDEVLLFMIRDMAGKFTWFGELFYKFFCPPNTSSNKAPTKEESIRELDEIKKPIPKEDELKPKSISTDILSSPRSAGASQELELLLQQQFEIEDQYEDSYIRPKATQIKDKSVSDSSTGVPQDTEAEARIMNQLNSIKMFLFNTGLLSMKDLNKVFLPLTQPYLE